MQNKKVIIIGLDCAPPALVFERFRDELPNLSRLMNEGAYGPLTSVMPPITVPAWMCMMSSKDPGTLGIYGFRHRKAGTYDKLWIATSANVREKLLWDYLKDQGKSSVLLGVPLTYPPTPILGIKVTDFLAPDTTCEFCFPPEIKTEIEQHVPGYMLDVSEFRTDHKQEALEEIYIMTEKRFRLARHLITTKPWDFFMMVEMGPDRLHHAFWKFFDPEHPHFEKGNPFENVALAYYKFLDGEIGKLLEQVDLDHTTVFVVSDHGAKKTKGNFCINEWLIEKGYLVLKQYPDRPTKIDDCEIDWSKTKAWAWGGYYARVFLNIQGREPQGLIAPEQVETFKQRLIQELSEVKDDHGQPISNTIVEPKDVYRNLNGDPPDLMAFFDDLEWRPIATIGYRKIHTQESDIGPDDAVHDWKGIFIVRDPENLMNGRRLESLSLLDVLPTVLEQYGITPPTELHGKPISLK